MENSPTWSTKNQPDTEAEHTFTKIPDNIPIPAKSFNSNSFYKGILYEARSMYFKFNFVPEEEKDKLTKEDELKIQNWVTANFSPKANSYLEREDPRLYSIRGFWMEDTFKRYIKNYEILLSDQIEAFERDAVKFPKGKNYFITLNAADYFDYNEWLKNPQHIWNLGSTDRVNGMQESDVKNWLPRYCIEIQRYPNSELSNFELIVVKRKLDNSIQTRSYYICRKGIQLPLDKMYEVIKRVGLDEFIVS